MAFQDDFFLIESLEHPTYSQKHKNLRRSVPNLRPSSMRRSRPHKPKNRFSPAIERLTADDRTSRSLRRDLP